MALSLPYTASDGQVPTAANFMANFSEIVNNPVDLWSPATKNIDLDGFSIILDAAGVTSVNSTAAIAWNFTPGAKSGTPSSTGSIQNWAASTYTDSATAGSGTATQFAAHAIQRPTLAATNTSVTTTDAATLYIANNPAAGTNETITNPWALLVDAGHVRFDDDIYWRSGTAFNGIFAHNITAARTWTFPDATGTVLTSGSAGTVVQMVTTAFSTATSTTATFPDDDTIPQIGEGTEWFTRAITPTSTTNRLVIQISAHVAATAGSFPGVALFQDATADALAGTRGSNVNGTVQELVMHHEMAAGTTSSTTFRVRFGADTGTTYINQKNTGARFWGGVITSRITIWEVVA